MSNTALKIEGMHCDACVRRVNATLTKTEGVSSANVAVGSADVQYDPSKTNPSKLAAAINKIGYTTSIQ